MAQINGGEISYGRTVKTGDFENKRTDVKLTFSVGDGEDANAIITKTAQLALDKCHEMLGIRKPAPAPQEVVTAKAEEALKQAEAPVVGRKPRAVPKVEETKAADPLSLEEVNPPKQPSTEPKPLTSLELSAETSSTSSVDPLALDDDPNGPVTAGPVSDVELTTEISSVMAAIKDGIKIRTLVAKYVQPGQRSADIPAEKRHAFLAELRAFLPKA